VSKTSIGKAKVGLDAAEKLRAAGVAERALWDGQLSLEQAAAIAPVVAQHDVEFDLPIGRSRIQPG
jgi:hypothetical protein